MHLPVGGIDMTKLRSIAKVCLNVLADSLTLLSLLLVAPAAIFMSEEETRCPECQEGILLTQLLYPVIDSGTATWAGPMTSIAACTKCGYYYTHTM